MYDHYHPQIDEAQRRLDPTYSPYRSGSNTTASLVALVILVAIAIGAIWIAAA